MAHSDKNNKEMVINFNSFILGFFNNSSHSTLLRVKCEKQILPAVGFEPTTSCIRGKRQGILILASLLFDLYREAFVV